jgi:hypothetical protein
MVGSIAGSAITAAAQKKAMDKQLKAIKQQRDFVYNQLEPSKISGMAEAADVQRAKNRLALQGMIDPALLEQRYASQEAMQRQLAGMESGAGDVLAQEAAAAAMQTSPQIMALKERLLDTAAQELELGGSLPPDVQAEVVKAGLERSGMVSGTASPKGLGGNIVRTMIGERGLALKNERVARATALTQAAQELENKRTAILASVFPGLKQLQLQNLQAQEGALQLSNQMVPEAGLGGNDIANLWLARVGATNQLAQSAADIAARGTINQGAALGQGVGGAISGLGQLLAKPNQAPAYEPAYVVPQVNPNDRYDWTNPDGAMYR